MSATYIPFLLFKNTYVFIKDHPQEFTFHQFSLISEYRFLFLSVFLSQASHETPCKVKLKGEDKLGYTLAYYSEMSIYSTEFFSFPEFYCFDLFFRNPTSDSQKPAM